MSPLALSIRFLQTQPDSKLIELARAGHERAFEALVQRYRRPLLRYCRRLSTSDVAAEDALQQALLQAWVALGSSEITVRDARAWLYRIVHNVAISNLRRPVHESVDIDPPRGASGADHEVESRLAVRDALAGLASLPELQRRVMLSTALEGRSHDEIADALGLSHGAVRGLIYRARATLRAAAAALTPSPLIHWAARQEIGAGGRSVGIYETIVGGSSAGIGGVLIKGGALVVSAGALATAAGITSSHFSHHSRHHAVAVAKVKPASDRVSPSVAVAAGPTRIEASQVVGAAVVGGGSASAVSISASSRSTATGADRRQVGSSQPVVGFVPVGRGSSPGGRDSSSRSSSSSGSGGSGGGHGSGGHDGVNSNGGSGGVGGGDHSSGSGTSGGGTSGGHHDGSSSGGDHRGGSGGGSGGGDNGGGTVATVPGTSTVSAASAATGGDASGDGSGDHHRDNSGGGGGGGGSTTTTTTVATTTTSTGGD